MSAVTYFATAAKGLEEVVATELQVLGFSGIRAETGGVHFQGTLADGYRACLWLRSANRVLRPLTTFSCQSPEELYEQSHALPWEEWLTPTMTLAVDANLRNSALTHSRYAALKVKDAVVDRIRDRRGTRPNVDPRNPDLRVNLHLLNNCATLSLDMAGQSLNRRGYRHSPTVAPLRETLAAGLVQLSSWDPETPFVDPMCGSGTLILEAALLAGRVAPGLLNPEFGFLRWPDFRKDQWDTLLEAARSLVQPLDGRVLLGADQDRQSLRFARNNAGNIPSGQVLTWRQDDLRRLDPPAGQGTLICNPPYGERLGDKESLGELYRAIGDTLKQRWTGWTAWIFTGNLDLAKRVGLKPSRRIVLYNGPIECRLLKYELY